MSGNDERKTIYRCKKCGSREFCQVHLYSSRSYVTLDRDGERIDDFDDDVEWYDSDDWICGVCGCPVDCGELLGKLHEAR